MKQHRRVQRHRHARVRPADPLAAGGPVRAHPQGVPGPRLARACPSRWAACWTKPKRRSGACQPDARIARCAISTCRPRTRRSRSASSSRSSSARITWPNSTSARSASKKAEGDFSQFELSSLELGLVNDEDLNETLKPTRWRASCAATARRNSSHWTSVSACWSGDATLQGEANPFSPQAICNAYKQACKHLELEIKVRMVFLKLFDDHVLDDIRSIYKDLNALLVQRSILPKIRYSVGQRNAACSGIGAHAAGAAVLRRDCCLAWPAPVRRRADAGGYGADTGLAGSRTCSPCCKICSR